MSLIAVVSAPNLTVDPTGVEKALRDLGHTVILPTDLSTNNRIDALFYISDSEDDEVRLHWLEVANCADRTVLISNGLQHLGACSDVSLPLKRFDKEGQGTELLCQVLGTASHVGGTQPSLVFLSSDASGPYVATSIESLWGFLADASVRAVAVTKSVRTELATRLARTRKEYDLVRYLRWSQDRLDTSFVSIRVGLTSTDTPTFRHSLSDIVYDNRSSNLIVVRGAPGAGKSLQLRHFDSATALHSIRSQGDDSPIVFCVNLGEHANDSADKSPFQWLESRWARRVDEKSAELGSLEMALATKPMVVLLDGLNEIPFANAEERRRWMNAWRACIHEYLLKSNANRVVVACRKRDLNIGLGSSEVPVTYVDMMPLEKNEILEIARRENFAAYDGLVGAFKEDPTLVGLYQNPFALSDFLKASGGDVPRSQSEIFWRRITSVIRRERDIAKNYPIFDSSWLPDSAVTNLVNASNIREAVPLMRMIPLLAVLGRLAHEMTSKERPTSQLRTTVDMDEALRVFEKGLIEGSAMSSSDLLYLAQDFAFLSINEGLVKFSHQTLQDFFAMVTMSNEEIVAAIAVESADFSSQLRSLPEVLPTLGIGDEIPIIPTTGFEEVFSRLVEVKPEAALNAVSSNPWLVEETMPETDRLGVDRPVRRLLIANLSERINRDADVREILASLWSLGSLGWAWPKSGKVGTSGQPCPDMVEVPSRSWALGVKKDRSVQLGRTQPWHKRRLHKFAIGKFPVTNSEFSKFLDAGGYTGQTYWSSEGWLWRTGNLPLQPVVDRWIERRNRVAADVEKPVRLLRERKVSIAEAAAIIRFSRMTDSEVEAVARALVGRQIDRPAFWGVDGYSNPLQPVVGVSFHEAAAYCSWLEAEMDLPFRLPSEDEWEAAALFGRPSTEGIDRIEISEIWSIDWGNTAELHLGRPSPVGAFGPWQNERSIPQDMAGNVFEWVTDCVQEHEDWCLVVKGGSFRHLMRRSHPGYRGRGDNTSRNDDNGFRVAVSLKKEK